MSKSPFTEDIDDLPPPYHPPPYSASASTTSGPSPFTPFLSSSIHDLQSRGQIVQDADDALLMSRISDRVDIYLNSTLSQSRVPIHQAIAVAIPEGIVGPKWTLVDDNAPTRNSGRVIGVVRVNTNPLPEGKGAGDEKRQTSIRESNSDSGIWASRNRGFDDWGRFGGDEEKKSSQESTWWNEEELARRLARLLQPVRATAPTMNAGPSSAVSRMSAAGSVRVRAEEVTFRGENDMGLWESKRGWALVVTWKD